MPDIQARRWLVPLVLLAVAGCGDDDSAGDADAADAADVPDVAEEGGGPDADADGDADADSSAEADADAAAGSRCGPLPGPTGRVIAVGPSGAHDLTGIVAALEPGDTLSFADGTYALGGTYLWVDTPNVTLRSAAGRRDAVVLDGEYETTEVITIAASDVTVADLTIRRPGTHGIHVVTAGGADTLRTRIYDVAVIDPGEQAIKINPGTEGGWIDRGEIACSRLELTDAGRPHVNPTSGGCYTGGIDAHQVRDWVIRDNHVEGFWCPSGLAEHGIHFWRGCRDPIVERNVLRDNARGIGFGLVTDGTARSYPDDPCPAAGGAYVDHYGGIARNNFVFASRAELFASEAGFDCGICFWAACNSRAVHNTIVSTGDNFSSIEWRFAVTTGTVVANNIATHPLRERDGATATRTTNLESAPLDLFVDGAGGDLHLAPAAAAAIDRGTVLGAGVCDDDIDGEPREGAPDLGADERPRG